MANSPAPLLAGAESELYCNQTLVDALPTSSFAVVPADYNCLCPIFNYIGSEGYKSKGDVDDVIA
jgi:hypothetical protein